MFNFTQKIVRSTAKDRNLTDRLVNAITMLIMMGLTWIFGYFLLVHLDVKYEEAMQSLFTIFNVFQVIYTEELLLYEYVMDLRL